MFTNSIVNGFALLRQTIGWQPSFTMEPMPQYLHHQNNVAYPYGNIQQGPSSMAAMLGMRNFSHTDSIYQQELENDDYI